MPYVPNASVSMDTTPDSSNSLPFDATLAVANTAQDFVTIPAGFKGKKISMVNEGPGTAFLKNDATATATATNIKVLPKDAYAEEGIAVTTRWSFIGETGKLPRIRGVVWAAPLL